MSNEYQTAHTINTFLNSLFGPVENGINTTFRSTKLTHDNENVYLEAPVVGIPKENIDLSLERGHLHIRLKQNPGKYGNCIWVGDDASSENCKATLENGLLKVVFPKIKPKTNKIAIS